MTGLVNRISLNLKNPQKGLVGWWLNSAFKKRNAYLEENAARLCNIQPDHKVLEIGFGPGCGLEAAYKYVKEGNGKIHGVDISEYMVEYASKSCHQLIQQNKLQILLSSVHHMPFNTDTFDRVFHVNSYYFWPSMKHSLREIYRVMKPGAIMVTTLNLKRLKILQSKGYFKHGNIDPLKYMVALEKTGFENVRIEYLKDSLYKEKKTYQAIFAEIKEKPAYDEEFEDVEYEENLDIKNNEKSDDP
ncbi:uncharacterized protein LOC126807915 [Patella vulgata]|uniref:uncharacterized protein LOC126807915 n=1 Tax=Patella vulgata TaxID=6465 RepID=UPI00217F7B10|nr:uncharacterized protein LOC126807915 [Patella vulgata]XP_050388761.1 uncharacterized protein LOC126807915 [Patella vulgata]